VSASSVLFVILLPPSSTLFPYTTLFRSSAASQDRRCRAAPERRHGQGATLYGAACNDAGSDGVAGLVAAAPWDDSRQGQSEPRRSEEHTSELQSREISYAVFCLKKKKQT